MASKHAKSKTKDQHPQPFTLKDLDPETYRQQSRRSSTIIIIVFAVSAMLLSSLLVYFFGSNETSNFKWNITGVILGLLFTATMVKSAFASQPWMAASLYGWQLKRSLMSVTNIMHHVKKGVNDNDHTAMRTLRFYHLGLLQMHKLDGNPSQEAELIKEINQLQEHMQAENIETKQNTLAPEWIAQIKANYPTK